MRKFEKVDDIPDFPGCKTKEEHQKLVQEYIKAGALPKSKLKVGSWYIGNCRNTNMAQWTGREFRFIRDKMSGSYIDTLNHFEDDDHYDLFVPFKLVEV